MKFAICQEVFEDWDWERQCEFAAGLGYTAMEVAPFTLAERISDVPKSQLSEMKQCAGEFGMEVIGLHWLLAKTEGMHLTSADDAARSAAAKYLVELGEACAELGGELLVFGSPHQRNVEEGMPREQAMKNAAEVFRTSMPALEDLNVRICMEPLTPKETNFINTCAEAMELIRMVDSPSFVLQQDVKAMVGGETESLPVLIHRHASDIGHFHVNDSNLLGPGMGETDYRPIIKALLESGYDGYLSVEAFDYTPGAEKIARESIEYLQRIIAEVS